MLFGTAGVRRIPLSGLDLKATGALVRRIVAAGTSREYVAEVHRRSGGNPFFATEVARLQASRGTPTGVVPVGVRNCSSTGLRPAAAGVGRATPGGQRGRCAGCGPPRQRDRTVRGRGGGAPRRTGRGWCRGGRCLRPRTDAGDAVRGDELGSAGLVAPQGGRASAGRRSCRAGPTLVAGVRSRRPAARPGSPSWPVTWPSPGSPTSRRSGTTGWRSAGQRGPERAAPAGRGDGEGGTDRRRPRSPSQGRAGPGTPAAEELARAVLALGGGVGGFEVDLSTLDAGPPARGRPASASRA